MNDIKLQTERLYISPLSIEENRLLAEGDTVCMAKYDVDFKNETTKKQFLAVQRNQYEKMLTDSKIFFWHSAWMLALKENGTIIGSGGFKGTPDANGIVEFHFDIFLAHEGNGYFHETIECLSPWLLKQKGVLSITTKTLKIDSVSIIVLQKNGFKLYKENGNILIWRLNR